MRRVELTLIRHALQVPLRELQEVGSEAMV